MTSPRFLSAVTPTLLPASRGTALFGGIAEKSRARLQSWHRVKTDMARRTPVGWLSPGGNPSVGQTKTHISWKDPALCAETTGEALREPESLRLSAFQSRKEELHCVHTTAFQTASRAVFYALGFCEEALTRRRAPLIPEGSKHRSASPPHFTNEDASARRGPGSRPLHRAPSCCGGRLLQLTASVQLTLGGACSAARDAEHSTDGDDGKSSTVYRPSHPE